MKILTLLRHAKSSWDDPQADDFERPLNARGRKAATAVGRELKARGLSYDLVLASPARRVVETLDRLADGYGSRFDVTFDERIYGASAEALLQIVRAIDDAAEKVLLVGHSPGLPVLASRLTRDDLDGQRARSSDGFPTGAVMEIGFEARSWRDVAESTGVVRLYLKPRELTDKD